MKTTKYLSFLFLPMSLLPLSCEMGGDVPDKPYGEEIHLGGEVHTSQLTIIEPGGTLDRDRYTIYLDDTELFAYRISDTQMAFTMPTDLAPGDHFVRIPTLDDHTLHYSVVQTVLPQTAQAVMAPFFERYEAAAAVTALPTENHAQAYLNGLVETFEGLSPADQRTMATYYYANRDLFDGLLVDTPAGKTAILFKYTVAVLSMGASVAIAWTDPEPISKSLFTLAAILTFQKAKKMYHQFVEGEIMAMEVRLEGIRSEFEKAHRSEKLEGGLEFSDGKAREVAIGLSFRKPIASDSQDASGALVEFFSSTSLFHGGIDKLNAAIGFVNENLFQSDIPLIEKNALPEQRAAREVAMTRELFTNLSVSVSGANVTLEVFELTDAMDLNIGLKLNSPMETGEPYVDATLILGYNDAFNGGSTSLPIRVNKAGLLLVGDLNFGQAPLGRPWIGP